MILEEEVCILDKYRLTPTQLRFIQLLLLLQEDNCEELFHKFIKTLKNAGVSPRDILISLQEAEIILKSYKIPESGTEFDPFSIPVNKNFTKNLYKSSFKLGKELFEAYPQFGSIGENIVPLRTVAKKFDSLEDAYFRYSKTIGWNPEKHNHIIKLVKWAGDNNLINCSLASFIINNSWVDLEALRNNNSNNIKLL